LATKGRRGECLCLESNYIAPKKRGDATPKEPEREEKRERAAGASGGEVPILPT